MGNPEHGRRKDLAVRDEYDPQGKKWITLFDPEHPEAWISVPYLEGSPPDFSDPATWEHLRREASRGKGSDRGRSGSRFRIK